MKELIEIKDSQIVRRIPLDKEHYNLGRGLENNIVLDTPKVSRLHAKLIQEEDSYTIIDNDSTNRLFVNGEAVQQKKLLCGDRINLSRETTLFYQCGECDALEPSEMFLQAGEAIRKNDFFRLKKVTDRIISLAALDNILDIILAEVVELIGAERGFIVLANEQGELQAETGVSHNLSLAQAGQDKAIYSQSIVQWVIENQQSKFILNIEDQPEEPSRSVLDLDLRSIMCAPLLFGDRLTGIVYVDAGYQVSDFSETDRLFFTILSDYAAIAIENAKLYGRVQMSNLQLREEVMESEERYRSLVELSPDAIVVHSKGEIAFVNPAAVKLLGAKKPEDLVGRPVIEIIHPESRGFARKHMRQRLDEGEKIPLAERKFLRLDGKAIDVEVTAAPLTFYGQPAIQVIARDISKRKRMEQELLRAQKLESVGVLAGGIAHDFNNLLQAIMGNAMLAKMDADDPAKVDLYLTDVETAVSRAAGLTRQLLTFSRGGAPVTQAAPIAQLLDESAAFALHGSKTTYKLDIEESLPLVEMDYDQINQVVHNLVINASQAMPMGGMITISASQIEISPIHSIGILEPGRYVKVSVEDGGVGIPAKILDKIFDPYFTTKQEGSGLGLASCYAIVTKHGGIIEAEPESEQGAVFTFYLPVSENQPAKKQQREETIKFKCKVLVMDDDDFVRKISVKILQQLNCVVESASDGSEAIELYTQARENGAPFDLVILDLTVPGGMGGQETIEKLKAYAPDIKAIAASGYSNAPVMSNPEEYGFQGVITKPFDLGDITRVLTDVLT